MERDIKATLPLIDHIGRNVSAISGVRYTALRRLPSGILFGKFLGLTKGVGLQPKKHEVSTTAEIRSRAIRTPKCYLLRVYCIVEIKIKLAIFYKFKLKTNKTALHRKTIKDVALGLYYNPQIV